MTNRHTRLDYPHDVERIKRYSERVDEWSRASYCTGFEVVLRDGTRLAYRHQYRRHPVMAVEKGPERREFSCYDEKEIKAHVQQVRLTFGHFPLLVRAAWRFHGWDTKR